MRKQKKTTQKNEYYKWIKDKLQKKVTECQEKHETAIKENNTAAAVIFHDLGIDFMKAKICIMVMEKEDKGEKAK